MAAVTICSDFGAPPQIKSATVSTVSPSISHEVMGPDAMILFSIQPDLPQIIFHSPVEHSSDGELTARFFVFL